MRGITAWLRGLISGKTPVDNRITPLARPPKVHLAAGHSVISERSLASSSGGAATPAPQAEQTVQEQVSGNARRLLSKLEEHGGEILPGGVLRLRSRVGREIREYSCTEDEQDVLVRSIKPGPTAWRMHPLPERWRARGYDPVWEFFKNGELQPFREAIWLAGRTSLPVRSEHPNGGVTPAELAEIIGCSSAAAKDYLESLYPTSGHTNDALFFGPPPTTAAVPLHPPDAEPERPARRPVPPKELVRLAPPRVPAADQTRTAAAQHDSGLGGREASTLPVPAATQTAVQACLKGIWQGPNALRSLNQRALLSVLWLNAEHKDGRWASSINLQTLSRRTRCTVAAVRTALVELKRLNLVADHGKNCYGLRPVKAAAPAGAVRRNQGGQGLNQGGQGLGSHTVAVLWQVREPLSPEEILSALVDRGVNTDEQSLLETLDKLSVDGVIDRFDAMLESGFSTCYEVTNEGYAVAKLRSLIDPEEDNLASLARRLQLTQS